MQGVLTGLFAVVGTVVGSLVTYLLQRRSAERAECWARDQRLWQERLQAYGAFAEAVIEYRRSQYDRWWLRHEGNLSSAGYIDARTESYRLKAIARQTTFRVKLLTSDRELIARVNEIMKIEDLHEAADSENLKVQGNRAQQLVDEFIHAASVHVQDISSQAAGEASAFRAG